MGTTCALDWRSADDRELVWTVAPDRPVASGVPNPIVIPAQEMYGEYFDIPRPDDLVFISSFTGGEVFRSGCAYRRGRGRVFYFSPGDQEFPVDHQPDVQARHRQRGPLAGSERKRQRGSSGGRSPTAWFENAEGEP